MEEIKVLKADYIWDGLHEKPMARGAIVIEGKFIREITIFTRLSTELQSMALNMQGSTLMPGLIDSHTHLSMDPTMENYLNHMHDTVPELTLRAVAMMRKDLEAGITTCRCLGDREFLDIACKKAVKEHLLTGPRLIVAGKGIRAPEGHGFVGYPFKGLNKMKKAVQENIIKGADLIKLYITGTLKGEGNLPSFLTAGEIKGIIDEAHAGGLKTASHCVGGIGLDWALEAGLDSLEHAYHISDRQIEKLGKSSTWPVLTPSPMLLAERIHHLPEALIPGHLREMEEIRSRMTALIDSGIPFALGSDGLHGKLPREMAFLVEMGASNLAALQAATIHGAKVAGIDHRTGSIEAGKMADIIAVKGNPLKDIGVLNCVKGIMKEGDWILNPLKPEIKSESSSSADVKRTILPDG